MKNDERTQVARDMLTEYGVPRRFLDAKTTEFPASVQATVGDSAPEDAYFVTGSPGTGKTHLAVGILCVWMHNQRYGVRDIHEAAAFVRVPDFLLEVREAFNSRTPAFEATLFSTGSGTTAVSRCGYIVASFSRVGQMPFQPPRSSEATIGACGFLPLRRIAASSGAAPTSCLRPDTTPDYTHDRQLRPTDSQHHQSDQLAGSDSRAALAGRSLRRLSRV